MVLCRTIYDLNQEEKLAEMSARDRIAFWNRQMQMEKEMDLQEIEDYKETQKLIDEGKLGYLPEQVSQRILKRMVSNRHPLN